MVTSFAGIADYSSWIYDILLLRRPGFIYVADVDSYLSQRELYFPIDSTPFPFSSNVEELCVSITNFYENKFNVLVNLFIENEGAIDAWECIGSSCRRHSSEWLINLMWKVKIKANESGVVWLLASKSIDTIIAHALLETLIYTAVYILLIFIV